MSEQRRPPPTGYRDEQGIYHPAPDTPAFPEHVQNCEPCKKHLGQPYTWFVGQRRPWSSPVTPPQRPAATLSPHEAAYHTFEFRDSNIPGHSRAITMLKKCDGDHPEPGCLDEQCHLKAPPIYTAEARVRQVGDHIELLCGACELPLSTDASVYVGDEEGMQVHRFVWHLACAKKYGEPT